MSFLRKMFGGGVEETDPRRYLLESMIGAIEADGEVTEEEVAALDKTLEEHDLFREIPSATRTRLIDMAADAIRGAGGAMNRLDEISNGLPGRGHRLTAYAMACEICVADGELPESEIRYLEGLQEALDLDETIAQDLFEAARKSSALKTAEENVAAMRELMPKFVDCMALMAAADEVIRDEELVAVRAVLASIPDMAVLSSDELNDAIVASFGRIEGLDLEIALESAAGMILDPSDRYWTTVYMMIIALADGVTDWREKVFLERTRDIFGLDDVSMDKAMIAAGRFPTEALHNESK